MLCSLTVGSENSTQDEAFKAIQSCLSKLESVSEDPTQLAKVDFSCSQLGRLGHDRSRDTHFYADLRIPHGLAKTNLPQRLVPEGHPAPDPTPCLPYPRPQATGRHKRGGQGYRRGQQCWEDEAWGGFK